MQNKTFIQTLLFVLIVSSLLTGTARSETVDARPDR